MGIKQNIVKGWITTFLGTVLILLTMFLIFIGTFDFLWEGIAGLSMGSLLLVSPKTIEKKISEIISNNKINQ